MRKNTNKDKRIKGLDNQIMLLRFQLFLGIISMVLMIGVMGLIVYLVVFEMDELMHLVSLIGFKDFTNFEKLISVMVGWIIIRGK